MNALLTSLLSQLYYIYIYIYIYIYVYIFIIQRVNAHTIPCPHQPPTRGDNTVSVAQGGSYRNCVMNALLKSLQSQLHTHTHTYIYYIYIYIYIASL